MIDDETHHDSHAHREDTPVPSRKYQIVLLLMITAMFFVNFLARVILAPLMPTMEKDLGLGHAGAGGLFMLISSGYSFALLGSGFLSYWFTHRKIIIISAIAIGSVLVGVAASTTLGEIYVGLALLGMAAGIYLPSGITTITSSINVRHWGKAIAFHELAPTLAFAAAPALCEVLIRWYSWKNILVFIGICSIVLGISFIPLKKTGNFKGEAPNLKNMRILMVQPAFWTMAVLFSLAIAASVGIYSMLPLYLVAERGMESSLANTVIAFSRIAVVVMALLAGWVSDRLGPTLTIKGVLIFNGITTILLGTAPDAWILPAVFLQPLLSISFFPAGFTVLSKSVPPRVRNIALSVTVFFGYFVGAGLIPVGMGILGEAGSFALAITIVGILIFASAFLLRKPVQHEGKIG